MSKIIEDLYFIVPRNPKMDKRWWKSPVQCAFAGAQ